MSSVTVLVVCTGNVCRSPIAERLLEAGLRERFGAQTAQQVSVGSAGTAAWVGEPMQPGASQALAELGVDAGGHAGRLLTADLVAQADLVLCAERAHRAAVVRLQPRATRRTFTLRELGALLAGVPAGDVAGTGLPGALPSLVAVAAGRRGLVPVDAAAADLPDPMGRPLPAFQACARTIAQALDPAIDLLAAAGSAAG